VFRKPHAGVVGLVIDDQRALGCEDRVSVSDERGEPVKVVGLFLGHEHELLRQLVAGQTRWHRHDVVDLDSVLRVQRSELALDPLQRLSGQRPCPFRQDYGYVEAVIERQRDHPKERLRLPGLDLPEEHPRPLGARLDRLKAPHCPFDAFLVVGAVLIRIRHELAVEAAVGFQSHCLAPHMSSAWNDTHSGRGMCGLHGLRPSSRASH
jgi:hypothetical protein